jgi:hypothetical protein
MTSLGALVKLQKKGAELYVQVAQFFSENNLIRDTWLSMAQDLEQQEASLRDLPGSFWTRMKTDEEALLRAIAQCMVPHPGEPGWESRSLNECFARTLDFEQPLILGAYVPLIRALRIEWTGHALDFYIMVKAHVVRLYRLIQPTSGDSLLIQRAADLLVTFEREVQLPLAVPAASPSQQKKVEAGRARQTAKPGKSRHESASPLRPIGERKTRISKHTKPLVKKLELPRRRVRR